MSGSKKPVITSWRQRLAIAAESTPVISRHVATLEDASSEESVHDQRVNSDSRGSKKISSDVHEMRFGGWKHINSAPTDGTEVWVYTAAYMDLPGFEGPCSYHPDVGWCTDEVRTVTHWRPDSEDDNG